MNIEKKEDLLALLSFTATQHGKNKDDTPKKEIASAVGHTMHAFLHAPFAETRELSCTF